MMQNRCALAGIVFLCSFEARASLVFMHESDAARDIVMTDDDGANPVVLTPPGQKTCVYPKVSADARTAFFSCGQVEGDLALFAYDIATRKARLIEATGRSLHVNASGNGQLLTYAYQDRIGGRSKIIIRDLSKLDDAGLPSVVRTISAATSLYFPAMSSDGEWITYERVGEEDRSRDRKSDRREIILESLVQKKQRIISTGIDKAMAPEFSFDNRYVIFTALKDEQWDLMRYDTETMALQRLTDSKRREWAPVFAPNGDVIFASDVGGAFRLFRMRLNGFDGEKPLGEETISSIELDLPASVYAPSISGSTKFSQALSAPIPDEPRSSFGSVLHQGRIYVVGGHEGHEHTYPPESFTNRVSYFDVEKKQWFKTAPRRFAAHGFEVIAYGDYVYAFGGFVYSANHKPGWKSIAAVERYDPKRDVWEHIADLPHPRSSNVAALLGDRVYLIGGWDATPRFENDYDGVFHRSIDVFDLRTERNIETNLKLPDPLRRAFTGVVAGAKIFLLGGLGQGASHFELLDQVSIFEPQKNRWTEAPPLAFPTFAPAAGFIAGELLVFGGMFKFKVEDKWDYKYVSHIYALDQLNGKWHHSGRYLTEAKGFSRVIPDIQNRLFVLGGHRYFDNGMDAPVATVEVFRANAQ